MFRSNKPTAEQHMAAAQQELEFLREQMLIWLRLKRQALLKKIAQVSAAPAQAGGAASATPTGDEDLDWLE